MTQKAKVEIGKADAADLEGILALQSANHVEKGGRLSAKLPRERIMAMMGDMPLIVARRHGRVVGFLMTCNRKMNADIPVISAMLSAYPGTENAYVYGPICVDEAERGKGIAQAMFAELRRLLPGREGILFIRCDNAASLRAHEKMGMSEVASFRLREIEHAVLSYIG